jgi:hypothetical protein
MWYQLSTRSLISNEAKSETWKIHTVMLIVLCAMEQQQRLTWTYLEQALLIHCAG